MPKFLGLALLSLTSAVLIADLSCTEYATDADIQAVGTMTEDGVYFVTSMMSDVAANDVADEPGFFATETEIVRINKGDVAPSAGSLLSYDAVVPIEKGRPTAEGGAGSFCTYAALKAAGLTIPLLTTNLPLPAAAAYDTAWTAGTFFKEGSMIEVGTDNRAELAEAMKHWAGVWGSETTREITMVQSGEAPPAGNGVFIPIYTGHKVSAGDAIPRDTVGFFIADSAATAGGYTLPASPGSPYEVDTNMIGDAVAKDGVIIMHASEDVPEGTMAEESGYFIYENSDLLIPISVGDVAEGIGTFISHEHIVPVPKGWEWEQEHVGFVFLPFTYLNAALGNVPVFCWEEVAKGTETPADAEFIPHDTPPFYGEDGQLNTAGRLNCLDIDAKVGDREISPGLAFNADEDGVEVEAGGTATEPGFFMKKASLEVMNVKTGDTATEAGFFIPFEQMFAVWDGFEHTEDGKGTLCTYPALKKAGLKIPIKCHDNIQATDVAPEAGSIVDDAQIDDTVAVGDVAPFDGYFVSHASGLLQAVQKDDTATEAGAFFPLTAMTSIAKGATPTAAGVGKPYCSNSALKAAGVSIAGSRRYLAMGDADVSGVWIDGKDRLATSIEAGDAKRDGEGLFIPDSSMTYLSKGTKTPSAGTVCPIAAFAAAGITGLPGMPTATTKRKRNGSSKACDNGCIALAVLCALAVMAALMGQLWLHFNKPAEPSKSNGPVGQKQIEGALEVREKEEVVVEVEGEEEYDPRTDSML
jgi:hypothetical protein